jgi:membrane protease YdiL (CAAX protease family)
MIGLVVLLLISWGLLFLLEKKNLFAIGIVPTPKHLVHFAVGLVSILLICGILVSIETEIQCVKWEFRGIRYPLLLEAFGYHLRSALTEDLVFRGALLYILIRRLGAKWAILLSAVFFGIYHVFSYGITGERWILITYVVLVTGFTGYVWAYAFHKTKSIYLGLGLHLGYNMLMACFYEAQPYGEMLFSALSKADLLEPAKSYYSFFRGLFPTAMTLILLKVFLALGFIGPSENKKETT